MSYPVAKRCVAIVYATRGGMGDVGKFAIAHALKQSDKPDSYTFKAVALSLERIEGTEMGYEVDVKNKDDEARVVEAMKSTAITKIDVETETAQLELEEVFEGVDAVVSCLGNRQPGYSQPLARWCTLGAEKVTRAMAAKKVDRLVVLSSFGIGDDFVPTNPITIMWGCMLGSCLRAPQRDLVGLETVVENSSLDYLLLRPAGLIPGEKPKGTWKLLKARGQGSVGISVSKSDVAMYMLQEAVDPTVHRAPVTIGGVPKKEQNSLMAEEAKE